MTNDEIRDIQEELRNKIEDLKDIQLIDNKSLNDKLGKCGELSEKINEAQDRYHEHLHHYEINDENQELLNSLDNLIKTAMIANEEFIKFFNHNN